MAAGLQASLALQRPIAGRAQGIGRQYLLFAANDTLYAYALAP